MSRIVFMGTPDFAAATLKALIDAGFDISLVVAQPDRPKGRGHKMQAPPVKELALAHHIEVFQPTKMKSSETIEKLRKQEADFFVVVAYGRILPKAVLELPHKGCINVHASLLPAWRGAAPIQYAIWNGDKETGVATMLMDEGMDTGDILEVQKTQIGPEETSGELAKRLMKQGADLAVQTLKNFNQITPQPQNHDAATYAKLILKEDRQLNLEQSAVEVHNHFRALTPFPGVFTIFRGKRLVPVSIKLGKSQWKLGEPGEIIAQGEALELACGVGSVLLYEVKPESKGAMSATAFANGYEIQLGERIGA